MVLYVIVCFSCVNDDTTGMFSIHFNQQGTIQAHVTDESLIPDSAAAGQMFQVDSVTSPRIHRDIGNTLGSDGVEKMGTPGSIGMDGAVPDFHDGTGTGNLLPIHRDAQPGIR